MSINQLKHRRAYDLIYSKDPQHILTEHTKQNSYKHSHLSEYVGRESRHLKQINENLKWKDLTDAKRCSAIY